MEIMRLHIFEDKEFFMGIETRPGSDVELKAESNIDSDQVKFNKGDKLDDIRNITHIEVDRARKIVLDNIDIFQRFGEIDPKTNQYVVSDKEVKDLKQQILNALGRTDLKPDQVKFELSFDKKDSLNKVNLTIKAGDEVVADIDGGWVQE
jgi:preprotein translocase subunit SecF